MKAVYERIGSSFIWRWSDPAVHCADQWHNEKHEWMLGVHPYYAIGGHPQVVALWIRLRGIEP